MPANTPPLKCLIIGTPGDMRVAGFQEALRELGHPVADVISYPDWVLLSDDGRGDRLSSYDRVRVESPGRDPQALHAIRWRWQHPNKPSNKQPGNAIDDPSGSAASFFDVMDHIILAPTKRETVYLNHPQGILIASDKASTIEHLGGRDVPVPKQLGAMEGPGAGYERVRTAMLQSGMNRVFIKLRHGASASGVIAYQVSPTRELATTTVAMEQSSIDVKLFNTRKIQRYTQEEQVRALLDALCPLGVYIERWVPKAGVKNRTTDLRVVTIAGKARHIVLRMSKGPITNLHLLNERSGPEPLKRAMRSSDWEALIETCERVARCFPSMLYLGIDVAVHADLRKHTVFEVNAWGDLLHGITDRGQTTYEAEVDAMADWRGSLD